MKLPITIHLRGSQKAAVLFSQGCLLLCLGSWCHKAGMHVHADEQSLLLPSPLTSQTRAAVGPNSSTITKQL